mgnify:CR=1
MKNTAFLNVRSVLSENIYTSAEMVEVHTLLFYTNILDLSQRLRVFVIYSRTTAKQPYTLSSLSIR